MITNVRQSESLWCSRCCKWWTVEEWNQARISCTFLWNFFQLELCFEREQTGTVVALNQWKFWQTGFLLFLGPGRSSFLRQVKPPSGMFHFQLVLLQSMRYVTNTIFFCSNLFRIFQHRPKQTLFFIFFFKCSVDKLAILSYLSFLHRDSIISTRKGWCYR